MQCSIQRGAAPDWVAEQLGATMYQTRAAALPHGAVRLATADQARFPRVVGHDLLALEDTFGQVALMTRCDERVRAILRSGRGIAEVWLPIGSRWNSTAPDPEIAGRIARILRNAARSGTAVNPHGKSLS
jgi:hypothetical protein